MENLTESISVEVLDDASESDDNMASLKAEFDRMGELIKKAVTTANDEKVRSSAIRFKNWLIIARFCNEHRKLAEKINVPWATWIKENIPAYSRRTMEDYCRLANIKNIEKYIIFGKARIMHLLIKVKDEGGEDPIGDLMKELKINFNPDDAISAEEFKIQLDIALQMSDLTKADILGVDSDRLRDLIDRGTPLTPYHIKGLKLVKERNGNYNEYLKQLYRNGGSIKRDIHARLSYRHVNDLATSINEIVTEHVENAVFISEVNEEILKELQSKVNLILDKINPTT